MPKPKMDRTAGFWIPAALWALLIFALSSIPGASFPASPIFTYDKLLHAGVYAVLGAFCFFALARTRARSTGVLVVIAGVMVTLYGCTDELHQLFVPGRFADLRDVLADCVGGFAGALVASRVAAARAKRQPMPRADGPSVK